MSAAIIAKVATYNLCVRTPRNRDGQDTPPVHMVAESRKQSSFSLHHIALLCHFTLLAPEMVMFDTPSARSSA
jgi:hypothetical protein